MTPNAVDPRLHRSDARRALRLLGRFTEGQHRTFYLALVMLTIEAATAVFEWYPLSYLIDYLKGDRGPIEALGVPADRTATVATLTIAVVAIAMVNSAADSLAEIFLARGGRTLGFRLRVGLFSHLQRLSLAFHDRSRSGDVIFRVVGDVKEFEEFVIDSLSDVAGSILLLVATIAFLSFESWQVTLVGLTIIPVLAVVSNVFSKRIKAAAKRQRAREGDLASATQEMLASIRVVQTFGRGGHDEERFIDHSGRAMGAALEAARLEAWFSWVVSVLEAVSIACVIWIGLWLIDRGTITVGMLVLLTILIGQMFKPTRKIIKEWNTIAKVFASVERIADLLDRPVTVHDLPGAVPAPQLSGQIELKDVSFAYAAEADDSPADGTAEERAPALRDVSFTVEPGQVVAIAGPSGAGKTTIAQLIPRLYDPQQGAVLVDGQDVRTFTLDSLRAQISMVLQETVLLSGTVAENIAYGRPAATREEIVAAAVRANADEFIDALPDGYDTDLTERAANLSGGQRQRIAIARALIRGTPILILDEPTTGLDARSAELVLAGLRELMQGRTTVVISHDLELIRAADVILVMESGEIVEQGAHRELLGEGGLYADLHFRRRAKPRRSRAAAPSRADSPSALPAFDPVANLQTELPALAAALDAEAMRPHLERMLRGGPSRWLVTGCRPGKALYRPDDACTLRYLLTLRDPDGSDRQVVVGGRMFADPAAVPAYLHDLQALADEVEGRPETAPFRAPVASIESMGMAAYAFPVDAELPTLAAATSPARMADVLPDVLPDALRRNVAVEEVDVAVARYPRRGRCLLRYALHGALETDRGLPVTPVVYGRLGGCGGPVEPLLAELKDELSHAGGLRIPRFLGRVPELDLALFEAIPGEPRVARLLAAHPNGAADELDSAIDTCAGVAARLHRARHRLQGERTLAGDIDSLEAGVATVHRFAPDLGGRLEEWLGATAERGDALPPLAPGLAHGDYTHTQVMFHDGGCGLVDFDDVCVAEPALDLGAFCAYLRVACRKVSPEHDARAAGDRLCERFLQAYADAGGTPAEDLPALRGRVALYEAVTLARIAVRSWHQLKPARIAHAVAILEEQAACLPHLVS
jgi:ABC-type multidrug transport system fused ATPase/permease subunit/Ser/Thr protein kinase RdoA (MazF antagonist)